MSTTKKTAKIRMFATSNDTDKYVVSVDGYFGLFDDFESAKKVYEIDEHIDDSGFGSMQIIPPGYVARNMIEGGLMSDAKISEYIPIDIANYMSKKIKRMDLKWSMHDIDEMQGLSTSRDIWRHKRKIANTYPPKYTDCFRWDWMDA